MGSCRGVIGFGVLHGKAGGPAGADQEGSRWEHRQPPGEQAWSPMEFCLPGYSGRQVPAYGPPSGQGSEWWDGGMGRGRRGNQSSQRQASQRVGCTLGLVCCCLRQQCPSDSSKVPSSRQPTLIHTHVAKAPAPASPGGLFAVKASLGTSSRQHGYRPLGVARKPWGINERRELTRTRTSRCPDNAPGNGEGQLRGHRKAWVFKE